MAWVLAAGLVGCADLSAIQRFSHLSADGAGYERLAREYVDSPRRSTLYVLSTREETQKQLAEDQTRREAALEGQLALLKTLEGYMQALGALAADDVPNADGEIEALIGHSVKNGWLTPELAGSATALAQLVFTAATDAYRQRRLDELVAAGNAPLQDIVEGMKRSTRAYETSLVIERDRIADYYDALQDQARAERQGVVLELMLQQKRIKVAEMDDRIREAKTYPALLVTVAEGHQRLYDERANLASRELLRQMHAYSKRIIAARAAMRGRAEPAQ